MLLHCLTADQKRLLFASVVCLGLHGWLFTQPVWQDRGLQRVAIPTPSALSVSLATAGTLASDVPSPDIPSPDKLPSELLPPALPMVATPQPITKATSAANVPSPAEAKPVKAQPKTRSKAVTKATSRVQPVQPQHVQPQHVQPQQAGQPRQPAAVASSSSSHHSPPGVNSPPAAAAERVIQPRFLVPPTPPSYPQAARQRRQEGTAIVDVQLNAAGAIQRITLQRSSGFPLLDRAALQAAQRWQFLPQQINGQGITHTVRIPVRFNLT